MIDVQYDIFKPIQPDFRPVYKFNFDIVEMQQQIEAISDIIDAAARCNEIYTPSITALYEINQEIKQNITLGYAPMAALIQTANQFGLPLKLVFLASQIYERQNWHFEYYSYCLVMIILAKLGFGPVQISRLIDKVTGKYYGERGVKEILFSKDNFRPMVRFSKTLNNFIKTNDQNGVYKTTIKELLKK